jgi:hypothetical protein
MTSIVTNNVKAAAALIALALAIGAVGIYIADADDAPGATVLGLLLMIGPVVLGVKAARTALAVGVLIAAFAAFVTHAIAVTAPLCAQARDVPSVIDSVPSPQYAAAVLEQNLPGVSVAVGAGGTIVWAEGFGWRDVETRTPVTSNTRFNIGTGRPWSLPRLLRHSA